MIYECRLLSAAADFYYFHVHTQTQTQNAKRKKKTRAEQNRTEKKTVQPLSFSFFFLKCSFPRRRVSIIDRALHTTTTKNVCVHSLSTNKQNRTTETILVSLFIIRALLTVTAVARVLFPSAPHIYLARERICQASATGSGGAPAERTIAETTTSWLPISLLAAIQVGKIQASKNLLRNYLHKTLKMLNPFGTSPLY